MELIVYPKRRTEELEGVRILISVPQICADAANIFLQEGVAAHGDYRNEPEEVLLRDAINDGVDYVLFVDRFDPYHFRGKKKEIRDLVVKLFLRQEQEVKTMSIGAAVKMVKQRKLYFVI